MSAVLNLDEDEATAKFKAAFKELERVAQDKVNEAQRIAIASVKQAFEDGYAAGFAAASLTAKVSQ